ESGIEVVWMDYSGYPEYRQLWGPYDPNLSIIDLMLNTGKDAAKLVAPVRSAPTALAYETGSRV
ncbi:MAG TPA: WbqC family protein, partial [Pseudolabrys sp.]|nr:WbqC family protein [Pseudolabrys sp.]